jgi:hypothetical protein
MFSYYEYIYVIIWISILQILPKILIFLIVVLDMPLRRYIGLIRNISFTAAA